jgi:hypothetical protein
MNLNPKHLTAVGAVALTFLISLYAGLLLSSWLTLDLLHLGDQVDWDASTFWQYWQLRDWPEFVPYLTQLKIAGAVGLGTALLMWLVLLVLLYKLFAWVGDAETEAAILYALHHPQLDWEPPPRDAPHEREAARPIQPDNRQPVRERGPLPAPIEPPPRTATSRTTHPTENDEMNFRQATAAVALAATAATAPALNGCAQKDYTHMQFRQNPHPVEQYEITVKVQNAPGPFKVTLGSTDFQIAPVPPGQEACLPPGDRFTGAPAPVPDTGGTDIDLHPTGPQTWTATVYADAMLEARYFDRGICKWYFTDFTAVLRATGTKDETFFEPSISGDDIRNQKIVVTYFYIKSYPGSTTQKPWVEDGITETERHNKYGSTIPDADLFTITLSARKVTP